jgi:hypothetical protein
MYTSLVLFEKKEMFLRYMGNGQAFFSDIINSKLVVISVAESLARFELTTPGLRLKAELQVGQKLGPTSTWPL